VNGSDAGSGTLLRGLFTSILLRESMNVRLNSVDEDSPCYYYCRVETTVITKPLNAEGDVHTRIRYYYTTRAGTVTFHRPNKLCIQQRFMLQVTTRAKNIIFAGWSEDSPNPCCLNKKFKLLLLLLYSLFNLFTTHTKFIMMTIQETLYNHNVLSSQVQLSSFMPTSSSHEQHQYSPNKPQIFFTMNFVRINYNYYTI